MFDINKREVALGYFVNVLNLDHQRNIKTYQVSKTIWDR